jgi:hypothetical protein
MKKRLPYEQTGDAIKGYVDSRIAKGETNDCVVRAFASSFEIPYDDAHSFVAKFFNRQPRKGTYLTSYKLVQMADKMMVVNNKTVRTMGVRTNNYMSRSLEYDVKVKGVIKKRQMTVGRFVKNNPEGTFFIIVRGHAFTIKDGVVIGNWDDAKKLRTRVQCAFQIK